MSKNGSQIKKVEGRDAETGRFLAGNSGNGGRKLGSRNKLSEAFISDLHERWIKDGQQVLDAVIKDKPHEFSKTVASLLPKQFDETVNLNVSMFAEIRDFTEAYRLALSVIGSNKAKAPKLIDGNGSH